jgi:uncharacterized membrane protein
VKNMDKWFYRVSVALAILGLLVSIYMTIYKLSDNELMCLGSGDCSVVVHSKYSEVNNMDVPAIGAVGFAAILAVLLFEKRHPFLRNNGTILVFGMALTGFLFVLWLIYVETVLIKAFCPFCITTQVTMILIFILSIIRLIRQPQL